MTFIRAMAAEDRPFVVSGWSASYRSSRDNTAPRSLYAKHKHEEVSYYLDHAQTLVAHGETGVLFGFMTFDPATYTEHLSGSRRVTLDGYVLYAYVALPFRRRGIASMLFAAAGISPTQRFGYLCRTPASWDLRSRIPLAKHTPNRARYEETSDV